MSEDRATDPIERLHDQERAFPDSRGEQLSRDNQEWIVASNESVNNIVRVERLRREYSEIWFELAAACRDSNRRPVVAALYHNDGKATYDELMAYTSCTRRTVRNHVYALRDADAVEVHDGRPAIITFPHEAAELLASDALDLFYSQE